MPEALWTADEIMAATGGALEGGWFACNGVSIDTRSIEGGDLFVALTGARDGAGFVGQAFEAGATGALVAKTVGRPSIRVDDTLGALEKLGMAARDRAVKAKRGAVTGSVGKTSLTQAIAAGLRLAGAAHSSVKSYNNHIGVPLTLARMPRDTERAVFEIGMNHADEIRPLSRMVQPHAALVTIVGPVHVENFPDGEAGVARAKAEIFEGLLSGGVAVLNTDDKWFDLLADAARVHGARIVTFGAGEACDAQLKRFALTAKGAMVEARLHGRDISIPIAQTGAHWGPNSLAALLMFEALDVALATGLEALRTFAPLEGRGAAHEVAIGGGSIVVVDESYNANPLSMHAALASLAARPAAGRRIAVLTDMLELGPDAAAQHAELAGPIEDAGVDLVFSAGSLMRSLWEVLPAERRGAWTPTAQELAPMVKEAVRAGDVVMAKGSNGSRASLIVKALLDGVAPASAVGGR